MNKVEKLIQAMNLKENMILSIRIVIEEQFKKMEGTQNLDEIDSENLKGFVEYYIETTLSPICVEAIVKAYEGNLTGKEVDSLLEFYESDTGRMLVQKSPLIIRDQMIAMGNLNEHTSEEALVKALDKYSDHKIQEWKHSKIGSF